MGKDSWHYVILVCLAASAFFLEGCKTSEESDTRFVNREVVNTTMGFDGFKFLVPSDYNQVDSNSKAPEDSSKIKAYESFVEAYENDPVVEYRESMLFSNGVSLIIFLVETQRLSEPFSKMTDFKRSRILIDGMDRHRIFQNETMIPGKVDSENGKLFGHVTFPLNDGYVEEQFVVMGNLRETYHFIGITPEEQARSMKSDLRAMIYSLQL